MKQRLIYALTLAGILPFVIGTVFSLSPTLLTTWQWLDGITIAYAATIMAFLGGIQWGMALLQSDQKAVPWLITSNIIALTAFTSLLISAKSIALILLIIGFLFTLIVDLLILNTNSPFNGYRTLRICVTAVVCVLLVINFF